MEPKVSVSQANAQLAQKGECWTWNHRLLEAWDQSSLWVTFCHWIFLLLRGNASDTKLALLPMLCVCEKLD